MRERHGEKAGAARGSRGCRGTTEAGRGRAESERGQWPRIAAGDKVGDCRCARERNQAGPQGGSRESGGGGVAPADPGSPKLGNKTGGEGAVWEG